VSPSISPSWLSPNQQIFILFPQALDAIDSIEHDPEKWSPVFEKDLAPTTRSNVFMNDAYRIVQR
jgi:hypothetical protein